MSRLEVAHRLAPSGRNLPHGGFLRRALSGGGRPLPLGLRTRMEVAFGHDFGQVRVHPDSAAADASHRLGASAFTFGSHVALGRGHSDLESPAGEHLLAHELAHTIQQSGAAGRRHDLAKVSDDGADEAEAERTAGVAVAGRRPAAIHGRHKEPVIQCQPEQPYRGSVRSPVFEELLTQETDLMSGAQGTPFTSVEIELARTVFGESIDYSRVRLLPTAEALWFRTVGNTVRIPSFFTVDPNAPHRSRPLTVEYMRHTFIHELTHVWQYQHGGTSYISYSLGPQIAAMVSGKGRNAAYCYEPDAKKSFWDFTPEQQGLLVENTFTMRESGYAAVCGPTGNLTYEARPDEIGRLRPIHERYVSQMRAALPAPEAEIRLRRASEVMSVPGSQFSPVPSERQLTPVKPLLEWRF